MPPRAPVARGRLARAGRFAGRLDVDVDVDAGTGAFGQPRRGAEPVPDIGTTDVHGDRGTERRRERETLGTSASRRAIATEHKD